MKNFYSLILILKICVWKKISGSLKVVKQKHFPRENVHFLVCSGLFITWTHPELRHQWGLHPSFLEERLQGVQRGRNTRRHCVSSTPFLLSLCFVGDTCLRAIPAKLLRLWGIMSPNLLKEANLMWCKSKPQELKVIKMNSVVEMKAATLQTSQRQTLWSSQGWRWEVCHSLEATFHSTATQHLWTVLQAAAGWPVSSSEIKC